MSESRVEEDLRRRFQELRAGTGAGRRPEFGAVMARAGAAADARPALEVVRGGRVGSRRWVLVGASALAATVAGLLLVDRGPSSDEDFARLVAAYSSESAAGAWRSPTSGLLAVPGMELTRAVPTIGVSVPGLEAGALPPEAAPSAGPREDG
jgi:hypothetical protein